MDWIKAEHAEFFSKFYIYLTKDFNYWGVKQDNGEYVWFCCLNESCQAGYLIEYIRNHMTDEKQYPILRQSSEIVLACYKCIGLPDPK